MWTATPTVSPGNSEVVDPSGEGKRQKPEGVWDPRVLDVSKVALGFISVDRNAIFGCKISAYHLPEMILSTKG